MIPPDSTTIHLITPEYPPVVGGVADHSRLIAKGLAESGRHVHVWCPGREQDVAGTAGVDIHRQFGRFGVSDLRRVGMLLDTFSQPRHLLVQWVPHGYGFRSVNLAFTLWLWGRSRFKGDTVDVLVHEPALPFRRLGFRYNAAAVLHRLMACVLLQCARTVMVTIPAWIDVLKPFTLNRRTVFHCLPVPGNIGPALAGWRVEARRATYATPYVIGCFGTLGEPVATLIEAAVIDLLHARNDVTVVLIGSGSHHLKDRMDRKFPHLVDHIRSTGTLPELEVSVHLQACDAFLQPYPDGVDTRRGSAMAILQHGKPLVTTVGRLSEPVWLDERIIEAAPCGNPAELVRLLSHLLDNAPARLDLGRRAKAVYEQQFSVDRVVATLIRACQYDVSEATCAS